MQIFNTISDMKGQLKSSICLIKFGEKENLMKLQHGEIYMKRLKYYNDLEDNSGKPDRYDGKWIISKGKIILNDKTTNQIFTVNLNEMIMGGKYENNPIFCLFCLDGRNLVCCHCNHNYIELTYCFSKRQQLLLQRKLGEYALIFTSPTEAINRINQSLTEKNYSYKSGLISYNKGNSENRLQSLFSNPINIVFNKELDFDYQQEFRYIITNTPVADHCIVKVKDMSDISTIIPTKKLVQTRISIKQYYSQI